jgi:hypothetical protein
VDKSAEARKRALECYVKVIEDDSRYENDVKYLPGLVDSMGFKDDEVILPATSALVIVGARFPQSMVEQFANLKGIPLAMELYCTTTNLEILKGIGDLLLLVASNVNFVTQMTRGDRKFLAKLVRPHLAGVIA